MILIPVRPIEALRKEKDTIRYDIWYVFNMQQITPICSTKNVKEPASTSLEKRPNPHPLPMLVVVTTSKEWVIDLFHNYFSSSSEQPNNVYYLISQNNQLSVLLQYFTNMAAT